MDYLELLSIVTDVSQNRVVSRYLNKLQAYHHPTYIHALHVAVLSVQIGYEYGLSKHRLYDLAYGALLHDIGKCKVPVSILNKKDKLTDDEFALIKKHPVDSYKLVHQYLSFDTTVSKMIVELICLMHHLKPDGSGYPSASDKRPKDVDYSRIPSECRIVTISDIYDALVEIRPYKHCFTHFEALDELKELGKRGAVDMFFVDILEKLIVENRLILQTTSLAEDVGT